MKMPRKGKWTRGGSVLLPLVLIGATFFFWGVESPVNSAHIRHAAASGEQDWKQEFDGVCAMTQDAMALSIEELDSLIKRCDALKSRIEKLDESTRKVYLRRLERCRDLYLFVLDSKRQK